MMAGKNGEPLYAQVNRNSKKIRPPIGPSDQYGNGDIRMNLSVASSDHLSWASAGDSIQNDLSNNPRSTRDSNAIREELSRTSSNAWI